jgi:hypothetical protein
MRFAIFLAIAAVAHAADTKRLLDSTAFVRSLSDIQLRNLVPERSGLYFVGCPNCNKGRQEEKLAWTPARPDEIYCKYCNHRYPSEKFPMNKSLEVSNPRGEKQIYRYWEDAAGYRYFFEARRDDLVKEYLAARARELGELYSQTHDRSHAQRAALLLNRFAEVFPGWCYHYDYPFQQKIIYEGLIPVAKFRPGYRTARWNWWAYKDIPNDLVQAYDLVRSSGAIDTQSAQRIERDLFRNAAEQVLGNPETHSNMSPRTWISLIQLGRVINEPRYVDEPAGRLKRFLDEQFFYDGIWHEGSPSYHAQTVGGLANVLLAQGGKSELAGAVDRSKAALMKMRFPDGRLVPVHDTWWFDNRGALKESKSYLLPGLGHAMLGGGRGAGQTQFHMTWSGGYGHQHADALSLLLFAHGRELLSDIGYTHTLQRAWAMSTVAHNTVVIDGANQAMGSEKAPTDGSLIWYETNSAHMQSVSVDGRRAYPGLAKVYRRTLTVVDSSYAVDVFEVEGGGTHDYFLHGDADASGVVEASVPLSPLATLLPQNVEWRPARNGGDTGAAAKTYWAYGHLHNLQTAKVNGTVRVALKSNAGPAVRVTLIAEPGSQLVTGSNPAVRGAKENDSDLDQYSRPFLMLRHEAANGHSRFVAVLEPVAGTSKIESVERTELPGGGLSIKVKRAGKTDAIEYRQDKPPSLRTFERLPLAAVEVDSLLLEGHAKSLPSSGDVLRVITADGWVYPFTIAAAEQTAKGLRVRVAEIPAFRFDRASNKLFLRSFPRREHSGAVYGDWLVH